MLPLTIRQLQVFESVARHLNHSRAAEELFLTQPAVSMQIKQLEQVLGSSLFDQSGKKLFLNSSGVELLKYCKQILEQVNEIETVFSEMKELGRGRLNISVVSTANYFMPKFLANFIQAYPKIQVSLSVANRDSVIKQLLDNISDLAIMGQPPDDLDLSAEAFLTNPIVVICSPQHSFSQFELISPELLAKETFLLRERGSGTRNVAERFFAESNLRLSNYVEMDTNEAIKQSVQANMGLGIISYHSIELELETGRLAVLNIPGFPIVRHWYIVHRKAKRLSLAAQEFKKFLLAKSKEFEQLSVK